MMMIMDVNDIDVDDGSGDGDGHNYSRLVLIGHHFLVDRRRNGRRNSFQLNWTSYTGQEGKVPRAMNSR